LVDGKLQDFIFDKSDLSKAILLRARLQGAFLEGAVLRYADLTDANLEEANFKGADLSGTDLSNAVLDGCDLREATFSNATRVDQITSALAANISEIKASEEVKNALIGKHAVSEPDEKRWLSLEKHAIRHHTLYGHDAND
jgi:uncharacterized protein YjbI with pentapeptide repeats